MKFSVRFSTNDNRLAKNSLLTKVNKTGHREYGGCNLIFLSTSGLIKNPEWVWPGRDPE